MNVTVIGAGYVGLVTAACLAEMGNAVLCLERDAAKVARLRAGDVPIHEPGLEPLLRRNLDGGRLSFTTDVAEAVAHGYLQFIAVGTPPDEDGSADLSHVLTAAREIAQHMTEPRVIIDKSTVPAGTAAQVRATVEETLQARGLTLAFHVVSNPEFLKEGAAVEDFMRPDRVVIGVESPEAAAVMRELYSSFLRNRDRLIVMDVVSAELTKYAANAMLATRISFMNELARYAEAVGADIEQVRQGIGADGRIGYSFLYAGCGYGGSCFPKDVRALLHSSAAEGEPLGILSAVAAVNQEQPTRLLDKLLAVLGQDLRGRHIALWGLAFKPETDDLREAPSLRIIEGLLARGATVCAYDPIAMTAAQERLAGLPGLTYGARALDAVQDADALVIVTEWKEFRSPDLAVLAQRMRGRLIVDGRNIYPVSRFTDTEWCYASMGRATVNAPA